MREVGGSELESLSRSGSVFEQEEVESVGVKERSDIERAQDLFEAGEVSGVIEAMGRLEIPPEQRERVEQVFSSVG